MMKFSFKNIFLIGLSDELKVGLNSLNMEDVQWFDFLDDIEEAMKKLQGSLPDCIFIQDLNIGIEVIENFIQALHAVYRTPVFLISNSELISQNTNEVFRIDNNANTLSNLLSSLSVASNLWSRIKTVEEELSMHKMQVEELSETNAHLITATFRERSLKKELEASKALIEEQSKKILDSINYSLRIQQSIIPADSVFSEALGDHFVYYRPKDVVSGDFPWMLRKDDFVYFAAVDCTGHGVPGAMMSMIGNLLLNSIVMNGDRCKTPSEILLELHKSVVHTLKQDADGNKAADGMDAALCRLNFSTGELVFSGAHLPLLLVRNGELEIFKGDKFPVGGMQYRNRNTYSDRVIDLKKGDRIYIYSDGIIDQIGGPEKLKWMSVSLKEFLVSNAMKPHFQMKEEIHKVFEEYKGDNKQVDDVLLIGVQY